MCFALKGLHKTALWNPFRVRVRMVRQPGAAFIRIRGFSCPRLICASLSGSITASIKYNSFVVRGRPCTSFRAEPFSPTNSGRPRIRNPQRRWAGLEDVSPKPRGFLRFAQSSPGHPTSIRGCNKSLLLLSAVSGFPFRFPCGDVSSSRLQPGADRGCDLGVLFRHVIDFRDV